MLRGSSSDDELGPPPSSSAMNAKDALPPPGPVQNAGGNGSESRIDVIAPAGKVGVVLDSPPGGGAPYVSSVSDSSPLKGEICVGDKVVAIDDADVSNRRAMDVSSKSSIVYAIINMLSFVLNSSLCVLIPPICPLFYFFSDHCEEEQAS